MKMLNYTSDDIIKEWSVDSQVLLDKENTIKSESLRLNNIQCKYLSYLKDINKSKYQLQERYAKLFKNKTLYYEKDGFFTKERLDAFGWDYDPFDGLTRPKTKDKLKIYFDADQDLLDLKNHIKELESMYEITKHILKQFDNFTFLFNNIKPNI